MRENVASNLARTDGGLKSPLSFGPRAYGPGARIFANATGVGFFYY